MSDNPMSERVTVVVIGGGQAGLVGRLLPRAARPVVRDPGGEPAHRRLVAQAVGLAAPVHAGQYDGLIGMPFPAPAFSFPTKDEMADYLEAYAKHFGCRCGRASRSIGCRATARATSSTPAIGASRPITWSSRWRPTRRPACRSSRATLDPGIVQLHSSEYRNPASSGPATCSSSARGTRAPTSRSTSHGRTARGSQGGIRPRAVPDRQPDCPRPPADRVPGRLSSDPHGGHADGAAGAAGGHLEGRAADPREARRPGRGRRRTRAAHDGRPRRQAASRRRPRPRRRERDLVHGVPPRLLVDRPADARYAADGEPVHERGIVPGEPGLYFVGLHFLYAFSSTMIHGVARDAERIADTIQRRVGAGPIGTEAAAISTVA